MTLIETLNETFAKFDRQKAEAESMVAYLHQQNRELRAALERADASLVDIRTHWQPANAKPEHVAALVDAVAKDHAFISDTVQKYKIVV